MAGRTVRSPRKCRAAHPAAASVEDSLATKLLPFVLSVIAGNADVIGFLGLNGLFTAHITGNLVVLAARLVAREKAPHAHLLAVPVFVMVLALTRLLAAGLERIRINSLLPLLLLQFLLLSAFAAICSLAGPGIDPNAARLVFAAMLGVAGMAVQNALVRIALTGVPSTAVMTTNVTQFTLDIVGSLLRRGDAGPARDRAGHTWPVIAGFLLGCALGAAGDSAFGLRSLAMPAGLALLAVALGAFAGPHDAGASHRSKRQAI